MDAVLNSLSYVGWVLLAIMILVFVHELGHFLAARLFKMRVDKFSVGFPPKLLGRKFGDTEYVIGLTPLGGYVKISGMVDESMDTDFAAGPPEPWEFRAKPVWQRIVVITAGVVFNIILAAIIFIGLKTVYGEAYVPGLGSVVVEEESVAWSMGLRTGDEILSIGDYETDPDGSMIPIEQAVLSDPLEIRVRRNDEELVLAGPADLFTQLTRAEGVFGVAYDPPVVGHVAEGSAAMAAGWRPGDWIRSIDGDSVAYWTDVMAFVEQYNGDPVIVRILRIDTVAAVPTDAVALYQTERGTVYEQIVTPLQVAEGYQFGILPYFRTRDYSLGSAIVSGIGDTWTQTRVIATSLKRVFTGRENFRENIGGPIMIAKVTKEAADRGAGYFWNIVAMLSITLAIINILPIPALDGGHLVFLIYEGITRREPSLKIRTAMQQVGMLLLLGFMAFVIFNDILKL